MSKRIPSGEDGFTLIEAMVALLILGIAATGIIRAAEAHVDNLHALERRAAAGLVAENALAEARLGLPSTQAQPMLGFRWSVRTSLSGSADPDLQQVTVQVSPAGEDAPLVTMHGFVDRGTTTP